ncbi:MAG: hypothetical protein Kow0098_04000 [Ignavibacteriaceae bacterium]
MNSESLKEKIKVYLDKYAADLRKAEVSVDKNFQIIVVIPAIAEFDNIKILLNSLAVSDPEYYPQTLFLFVVNNSPACSTDVKENNYKTIELLHQLLSGSSSDLLMKKIHDSGMNIGLIDASSPGKELPEKYAGVGLARKTGMDSAALLFNTDTSRKQILISLDADCTVSGNYITAVADHFNKNNLSAANITYRHPLKGNEEEQKAIICYEIFLRYYVLGLKYAGSPYAFQTVGSAMACDLQSYIKAEGMNKRKAAEDFYFLQKLSKVTYLELIKSAIVYPGGRKSWRVPFGTGQRVTRFLTRVQNEYLLYNPDIFEILKDWCGYYYSTSDDSVETYIRTAGNIHSELLNFLKQKNFEQSLSRIISNSPEINQFKKQKQKLFDGFLTLKLVHHLRDKAFPQAEMFPALGVLLDKFNLNRVENSNKFPSVETQFRYLNILRELE